MTEKSSDEVFKLRVHTTAWSASARSVTLCRLFDGGGGDDDGGATDENVSNHYCDKQQFGQSLI